VPKSALTVGVGTVMDAREVLIIITGIHKAFALAQCVERGVSHMYVRTHTGTPAPSFRLSLSLSIFINPIFSFSPTRVSSFSSSIFIVIGCSLSCSFLTGGPCLRFSFTLGTMIIAVVFVDGP
jgi:hypothetical protein